MHPDDVGRYVKDQQQQRYDGDAPTLCNTGSRYQASNFTESVPRESSRPRARNDRRNRPQKNLGRVYNDSRSDAKYDKRPSRRDIESEAKGRLVERRRSPSKERIATREHERKGLCEPEPLQYDSEDSFTWDDRVVPYYTVTKHRAPRAAPMGARFLDSGPSSGRAGYYESGGLYPPFDTGLRNSTRHRSRHDEDYGHTPDDRYDRYDRFPAQHGQYGNQLPVRYPEPGYVPRPSGYDRVPPRMIEGPDRHQRLLKAPSDRGSHRGRH